MATVLKSYDKWKQFLGERVSQAERVGMSEETVTKLAVQIGEFLQDKIDPENDEERVLKEIWDVADEQERKVLARVMVKLVSK
jgi:predicted metal-binding transcription factor (methanogenesis marker protein 9)